MIPSAIFLLLATAFIVKMIYDVQKIKSEKLEAAYLQFLAGIEVEEELAQELRKRKKLSQEKLKKEAQKTAKGSSDEVLPIAQTAAEELVASLERLQQREKLKQLKKQ